MTRRIETLKAKARIANRNADWPQLELLIKQLDKLWDDDWAAMRFYTELEQDAPSADDAVRLLLTTDQW